jgi:uncharacterized cupredoxin-like copper-binding protein
MSTTIDPRNERPPADLADEVHELEAHEAALERRTSSLELSGPLGIVLSLAALALSIGALVVAFGAKNDTPGVMSPGTMTGSGAQSSMMAGSGGHGRFTSAMMAAAAHGKVYVQLGDYWAGPAVPSVRSGAVTFVAKNVGRVPHELMVERMPMKFDAPMQPDEGAAQGMIEDMDPGDSGRMTMSLEPGSYMLFCNVAGHYAAGQHMTFAVTKS